MYHEATFAESEKERAAITHHSTARQAATIAKEAEAKKLVIGHYSSRYDDEQILLEEAQTIFPESYCATEGAIFRI